MEIPSVLKAALSWLVGALAFVMVSLGLTVLYMVLTKVPAGLWFNLLVFSIISGLAGVGMGQAAKKLADWLRALLGVKS
jgi:hypothetical protein